MSDEEPITLTDWVEGIADESAIDPDEVIDFGVILVYDDEHGRREVANGWGWGGETADLMSLVAESETLQVNFREVDATMRGPNDDPVDSPGFQ